MFLAVPQDNDAHAAYERYNHQPPKAHKKSSADSMRSDRSDKSDSSSSERLKEGWEKSKRFLKLRSSPRRKPAKAAAHL